MRILLALAAVVLAVPAQGAIIAAELAWQLTVGSEVLTGSSQGWHELATSEGQVAISPYHRVYPHQREAVDTAIWSRSYDGQPVLSEGQWTFELDDIAWVSLGALWGWSTLPVAPFEAELWLDGEVWIPTVGPGTTRSPTVLLEPGIHTFAWRHSTTAAGPGPGAYFSAQINSLPEPALGGVGLGAIAGAIAWRRRRAATKWLIA